LLDWNARARDRFPRIKEGSHDERVATKLANEYRNKELKLFGLFHAGLSFGETGR
jgi:hypothetical protein